MLIIFGGLPGSGKSTVAQRLARRLEAVYLRVDSFEQAVRAADILPAGGEVGPAGYIALYRVAADNLLLGHSVIADTVNPNEITRNAFRQVAAESSMDHLEVEIRCSDKAEHRRRLEQRVSTVEGLVLPTWEEVEALSYEPWTTCRVRLDTADLSVEDSVAKIMASISPRSSREIGAEG